MNCKHPDRDQPKMVCGYPLPCPFHTIVIDATRVRSTEVTIPISRSEVLPHAGRLLDIGDAVGRKPKKRVRK